MMLQHKKQKGDKRLAKESYTQGVCVQNLTLWGQGVGGGGIAYYAVKNENQ
jgi:hypothetical protein